MKAPEQIWAWEHHPVRMSEFEEGGWYSGDESPPSSSTSYTRTDVAQAMVAAAYEAAAKYAKDMQDFCGINIGASVAANIAYNVRALTPTDAKAALDRIVQEAVREALAKAVAAVAENIPEGYDPKCATPYGVAVYHCIASIRALKGGEA